jgi:CRP-like cAMP-binding protein
MPAPYPRSHNVLLDALPEEAWERLAPQADTVTLPVGQVVYQPGACMRHVYFPTTCVLAMLYLTESGHSAEVAMIGREGMSGVTALLGADRSISQVEVRGAGRALRLPVARIRSELGHGTLPMQVLLGYAQSFIGQLVETAACNRHATLEQRLCRWLLANFDRMPGEELTMTHELIAGALGVKREGVTEAAGRLRRQGAIHYHRGRIRMLDRSVLEHGTCECSTASVDSLHETAA